MSLPFPSPPSLAIAARCAASLLASTLLAGSAAAASFRIDFYEGVITGDVVTTDWDGDGLVDHSGLFTTSGAGIGNVSAFDVTIAGERYDQLETSEFPGAPSYISASAFWPVDVIQGFVFEERFGGPGDTVTVLQMDSIGIGDGQGGFNYYGTWGLSPCTSGSWCGGGAYRGSYTITELNTVPAPASLSLGVLGLLAAWRRRGR
jgi:hypothetical protein